MIQKMRVCRSRPPWNRPQPPSLPPFVRARTSAWGTEAGPAWCSFTARKQHSALLSVALIGAILQVHWHGPQQLPPRAARPAHLAAQVSP